jgi:hypothetical protein
MRSSVTLTLAGMLMLTTSSLVAIHWLWVGDPRANLPFVILFGSQLGIGLLFNERLARLEHPSE